MNADAFTPMPCMVQYSNQHPIMLCGMHKNVELGQLIIILYQDGKRK